MRQRQFTGPTLPRELRDQIGDPANRSKSGRGRNGQLNRKERRKVERSEKKVQKKQNQSRNDVRHIHPEPESEEEEHVISGEQSPPPRPVPVKKEPQKPLKSILKKTRLETKPHASEKLSLSPSPPVSRTVSNRLVEDDAEIAALERKLGIKGKKWKSIDDGLDDLFGDLGAMDDDEDMIKGKQSKRKRYQDEDWLASKRRKALGVPAEASSDDESDLDAMDHLESIDDVEENSDLGPDEKIYAKQDLDDSEGFEGFESDVDEALPQPRVRENPYVAPVTPDTPQPFRYIPPALRGPPSSDAEALSRLRRQIQGLFNRLSDANLLTILRDMEEIFSKNARGYVTSTLVDLLIGLLADETTLLDTFLILHAGFIAAIYKVIGTDFGALMVERVVSEFDKHYPLNKAGSGKQTTNFISVIAVLYSFQVVGSNLVFDYVKQFLDELNEINTELLLRIVRVSGSQLRQDNPTALKDIVLLLQKAVAEIGENKLSIRTKFMIETVNNLKNNRMKTGVAASAIVSEHTTRMKKHLGSLNTRNLKGTEPLRIGLTDIKNTEKKGKWWLVGASWRNDMVGDLPTQSDKGANLRVSDGLLNGDDGEVDLLQLAREQRMNTDVRRAIFVTIMSASDFKDAHVRLQKLNLRKSQELEVPRVIVHCAGCERNYNPYYTVLARKYCSDHKSRKCFQFALWDFFRSLGEKKGVDDASDDEDDTHEVSLQKLVNLGKLYGTLIAKDGLPIISLKPLDLHLPSLKEKTKTFIEIMLVTVILESQKAVKEGRNERGLLKIFINADTALGMVPGLQYFLRKVVSKTEITANKAEKETVKWACRTVGVMLTRLMATTALDED